MCDPLLKMLKWFPAPHQKEIKIEKPLISISHSIDAITFMADLSYLLSSGERSWPSYQVYLGHFTRSQELVFPNRPTANLLSSPALKLLCHFCNSSSIHTHACLSTNTATETQKLYSYEKSWRRS